MIATPVTPTSVLPAHRKSPVSVPAARTQSAVGRVGQQLLRNLAPAAVYLTVAPALMTFADVLGASAAWPRHWLLAATGAACTVLADRLRARPAAVILGTTTAVLIAREAVKLVVPGGIAVSSVALAIAAGVGLAIGRWQTARAPRDESSPHE